MEGWIKSFGNLRSRKPRAKQRIITDAINIGVEAMPAKGGMSFIYKETSILSHSALREIHTMDRAVVGGWNLLLFGAQDSEEPQIKLTRRDILSRP